MKIFARLFSMKRRASKKARVSTAKVNSVEIILSVNNCQTERSSTGVVYHVGYATVARTTVFQATRVFQLYTKDSGRPDPRSYLYTIKVR